jgi:Transposase DDE domain
MAANIHKLQLGMELWTMRHLINPQQGRLFDPFQGMIPPLGMDRIRNGWQGIFRTTLLEIMPARELGEHFDPTMGRPTKELYSVAGLLFLQEFMNWTVPDAVEAYLFHTDIQFALNLEPGRDQMCERTLERYRALFLKDECAGQIMKDVTDRLIDLLETDISRQRLDSTHVFSNMASFGRTRLMAVAIKRFLTQVKRHHLADFEALPDELRQRYAPAQAQLLAKDSKDAEGRAKSRQCVAEDLRDLIERFADHKDLRDRPSYKALVTVFEQQCEIVEQRVQVRSKTGGNCMQNPSDLAATYDGKKGQGYQLQLSETCAESNDVQMITAALPQTAVESDAKAPTPMLEDLQTRQLLPEEMLADTAYGSDDNVQQAAKLGVEIISPVAGPQQAATAVATTLTIDDFAMDERSGRVEACPAGRLPLQVVYDEATTTTTVHMSPEDCRTCPFRQQCPIQSGPTTYKASYTDKERRLAGRRREQETSVFGQRYALRSGLESTNSGLKRRLGLGRLRVRGRAAVFHALYLKVAGWNLLRAAASGKLKGRVAHGMARLGLALRYWLAIAAWALGIAAKWSAGMFRLSLCRPDGFCY